MRALPDGRSSKQLQNGWGVVIESDDERASIEPILHEMEKVRTSLIVVERATGTSLRRLRSNRRAKATAAAALDETPAGAR